MTDPPIRIRDVASASDLASLVAIVNDVTPDDPTSLEDIAWSDATYPGTRRFVAEWNGAVVGMAHVGRIYIYPPDYRDAWASIVVRPEARRMGIGSALLVSVSDAARTMGKTGLQLRASAARPDGISFLEQRGFSEIERSSMVRLALPGLEPPTGPLPAGIAVASLAERPDLVAGVHEVALEAFADIPGGGDPMVAGDLAEFRARDVDRPGIPSDGFMIGLDIATGTVVGYASIMLVPGSGTTAWHDMTAVRRNWRGRGLATALKRATIGWAIDHGLTALITGNDEANEPMRAVNRRLGYEPLPDEVFLRGPLVSAGA